MEKRSGLISLILAAFILGTFGVWIRILNESFGNNAQVVVRSLVASVIVIGIIFIRKPSFAAVKKNWKYLVGFSIVFPLSLIAFTASATSIKVTNALFMLYVGSLISTYLWGRFMFNEKFTAKKIFSIVLLLAGLYLFVHPFSVETFSLGVVLGIISGLLEGSAHAFRKLMHDLPREVIVFFQSVSAVVVALVLFVFSNQVFFKDVQISGLLVAVLFGALLVAIGYLLAYGFTNYDVNAGTIILTTELFFALVINYVFLHEVPTALELIGGVLIFAGATITSVNKDLFKRVKLSSQPTP